MKSHLMNISNPLRNSLGIRLGSCKFFGYLRNVEKYLKRDNQYYSEGLQLFLEWISIPLTT